MVAVKNSGPILSEGEISGSRDKAQSLADAELSKFVKPTL